MCLVVGDFVNIVGRKDRKRVVAYLEIDLIVGLVLVRISGRL